MIKGYVMAPLGSKSSIHIDMNKLVSILCYITPIGWLVAMLLHGNHKSSLAQFHLRQSLGLLITAAMLSFIPLIGWLLQIMVLAAWIQGLYFALLEQQKPVFILGDFYQSHLDFI